MAMAMDARSLLQKLRGDLLKNAGLDSDPHEEEDNSQEEEDPPTLEEIVRNAIKGPFRCEYCRSGLLLGPKSRLCATCGALRDGDASSYKVSFTSTLAHALLLSAFDSQATTSTDKKYAEPDSRTNSYDQNEVLAEDFSKLELRWCEEDLRAPALERKQKPVNPLKIDLEALFNKPDPQKASINAKESSAARSQETVIKYDVPGENLSSFIQNDNAIDLFSGNSSINKTHNNIAEASFAASWKAEFENAEDSFHDVNNAALQSVGEKQQLAKRESSLLAIDGHESSGNQNKAGDFFTNDLDPDDFWSGMALKEDKSERAAVNSNKTLEPDWPEAYNWSSNGESSSLQKKETNNGDAMCFGMNGTDKLDIFQVNHFAEERKDKGKTFEKVNSSGTDIYARIEEEGVSPSPHHDGYNASSDSERIVESLLSNAKDLSFMLSDNLVIPDHKASQ